MFRIWIYVHKLNGGNYYVGKTARPVQRLGQHASGEGSAWTRLHGGAEQVECTQRMVRDEREADDWENIRTLQLMRKHGWKKVRGGWFCNTDEVQTEKALRHHRVFDEVNKIASKQSARNAS